MASTSQVISSSSSSQGMGGGLRRSPSLLSPSLSTQQCLHQMPKCIAQAKQVEMEFANLSKNALQLTVSAPNGEKSSGLELNNYGETVTFCPHEAGCGHGNWKLELHCKNNSSVGSPVKKSNIFLDGVGSLFFTIDDHFNVRLSHQEFLRFPSATRQCTFSGSKRG